MKFFVAAMSLALFFLAVQLFRRQVLLKDLFNCRKLFRTKEEAKEAIRALRDTSLFPELNLQDVEISDYSFTLKNSPKTYQHYSTYGEAVAYRGYSVGSSESFG